MRTFLILATIEVSRCANRIFVARFVDRENARSEDITQGGRSADLKQTELSRHLRSSYCSRDGVSVIPLNNDRSLPETTPDNTPSHTYDSHSLITVPVFRFRKINTHIRPAFYSDVVRFTRNFSGTTRSPTNDQQGRTVR